MQRLSLFMAFILAFSFSLKSQDAKTLWDNTISKNWPENFTRVEIKSSADGKLQNAVYYKTSLAEPQPLIISLHTWSGNYLQEDPLANEVALRGWNYIHPDFRGPNNRPEACGSSLVISDIEDAVRFAIENGNVDKNEVHIVGVSGGGYATLLSFMNLDYPVKSFSAWASISNLEDWYWECKGRNLKYARDLGNVTTDGSGFDASEAKKRSPLFSAFPKEKRQNASLFIYAGIHDGYTGSVPITQSIRMYNQLLREMYSVQTGDSISCELQLSLLKNRLNRRPDTNLVLGGRKVHLFRELPNLNLVIFEGTHEMLVPQALALIPVNEKRNVQNYNILTIGDSNGAAENGWPVQLRKLLPYSTVINKSISGNTIGFDNLENPKLNTLRNIEKYLDETFASLKNNEPLDYIIIGLGTNDTKRIFINNQDEVAKNLSVLIDKIKQYFLRNGQKMPEVIVLSAPPMDEEKLNKEKYGGGDARISANNKKFREVAKKQHVEYLDIYSPLKMHIGEYTIDGVHFKEKPQFGIAEMITEKITEK